MHRSPLAWLGRYTRALFRDSFLLLREFWGPLVALISISLGVATLFYLYYPANTTSGRLPFDEALYLVVTLTVIEGAYAPPSANHWLILFYFLMPFVGILLAGQGFANFLTLFFNRQARGQAWKVAIAGTLSRHVVVCGGGHVGSNVADHLASAGSDVVLIEQSLQQESVQRITSRNVVALSGDVRDYRLLEQAGIGRAVAVVICTDNDLANLEAAIHCRELNPAIRIVLRMFDGDLAAKVKQSDEIQTAYSSSALAAPVFAGAALDLNVLQTFYVGERVMSVARMDVDGGSEAEGLSVGAIERAFELSVIMTRRGEQNARRPAQEFALRAGDCVLALGELAVLHRFAFALGARRPLPVVVCGGGRVGAKVALTLAEAGTTVTVIEQDSGQPAARRAAKAGIPIVQGDVRDIALLRQAGVEQAGAVVVCTDNDLANLESAIHCRELNPKARIVLRMFDGALARKVKAPFKIDAAYSSSALAAPVFAGAALDVDVQPAFTLGEETVSIARTEIRAGSRLAGMSVRAVEDSFDVSIIMAWWDGDVDLHPAPDVLLNARAGILALGTVADLHRLSDAVHEQP